MALRDANVTILCNLVLEWIHRNWEPAQLNVDQLTAKVTRQTFPCYQPLTVYPFCIICLLASTTYARFNDERKIGCLSVTQKQELTEDLASRWTA